LMGQICGTPLFYGATPTPDRYETCKASQSCHRYDAHMQLDEMMIKKIETLALLTGKSPEEILNEALEGYIETQQEKLEEAERERRRKETTFTYDEFWDGVDV